MSILSIPLRLFAGWEGVSPRQRKWERVLEAALTVPRYRSTRARLEWARHTSRFRMDAEFADPVALRDFFEHVDEFRSELAAEPGPAKLHAPWPGARAALALQPWFPVERGVSILHRTRIEEVAAHEPELLAGGLDTLRELALALAGRRKRIESVKWGVIVWTGPGRPALTPAARALLWRVFEVPVWEQFRGFQGELLAEQCEAGDGWHFEDENAIWEAPSHRVGPMRVTSLDNPRHPVLRLECGFEGRMVAGTCDCGRKGARAVQIAVK